MRKVVCFAADHLFFFPTVLSRFCGLNKDILLLLVCFVLVLWPK
jgi:hypothetical protein